MNILVHSSISGVFIGYLTFMYCMRGVGTGGGLFTLREKLATRMRGTIRGARACRCRRARGVNILVHSSISGVFIGYLTFMG